MGAREREKARQVAAVLAREYRKVPSLDGLPLTDRLVLLLLSKDCAASRAVAALANLKRDFVDWNEIRVSPTFEIEKSFEPLGDADPVGKAARLRTLFARIFEKRNSVQMDWIRQEEPSKRLSFLESLQALEPHVIHAFLLSLEDRENVLYHGHMSRVLQRIGVIPRTASPSKAVEAIGEVVPEGDALSFQTLLVRHGEEVCGAKVFDCEHCRVLALCRFGRARA